MRKQEANVGSIYRSRTIAIAKKYADEGYTEGPNNWTIFSKRLDDCFYYDPQYKQNEPWCHNFINAIFLEAVLPEDRPDDIKKGDAQNYLFQPEYNNLSCGCTFGADYFRKHGQFYDVKDAWLGDIIYFGPRGNESHVGIIIGEETDDEGNLVKVYTVEGNKGNKVAYGSYYITDSYISGVGKMRFSDYYDSLELPEPEPTIKTFKATVTVKTDMDEETLKELLANTVITFN